MMMKVPVARRVSIAIGLFYGLYCLTTLQLFQWIDPPPSLPPSITSLSDDPAEPLHVPKKHSKKDRSSRPKNFHKEKPIAKRKEEPIEKRKEEPVEKRKEEPIAKPDPGHFRKDEPIAKPDPDPPAHHKHVYRSSNYPPKKPSPYEERTREKLPDWADKPFFFRNHVPKHKDVCFVHVGKTAGSTLACHLAFTYKCGDQLRIPDGKLPKYTTNLIHNTFNDCRDDMAYYLIATRHPLKRIQSWFTYERPIHKDAEGQFYKLKKPLFIDCPFATLNDLGERGLRADGNATQVCKDRAWAAIRGTEMHMRHNYYNFGHYLGETPANATLMAIRSEHLQDDWISAELELGGDKDALDDFDFKNRNPSKKSPEDLYLSDESRRLLCQALCQEIQTYKSILQRAVNLKASQVEESIQELEKECPVEARATTCDLEEQ